MPVDFAPNLHYAKVGIGDFRFWCQKTLPLVYDDSLSYYELLCKLTKFMVDAVDDIGELGEAYVQLQDYVNHYFDNLDVGEEIDRKLDEMVSSGELGEIISQYLPQNNTIIVTASYGETNPVGVIIDPFTEQVKRRIEANSNNKVYYGAIGFASFAPTEDSTAGHKSYLEVLQTVSVPDPGKIGLVLVVGGGNDVGHTRSGISNGMDKFTAYVKEHYPNAVMRFAWCSWRKVDSDARPLVEYNNTIEAFKELCPRHAIGYCANSEYIFHQYYDDWYAGVGSYANNHPSTLGSQHIADHIVDCILTGSTSINRKEQFDKDTNPFLVRDSTDYPIRDIVNFTIKQVDGTTYVIPGGGSAGTPTLVITPGTAWFPTGYGDSHEMGRFSSGLMRCILSGVDGYRVRFPIMGILERTVEGSEERKVVNGVGSFSFDQFFVQFPRDWTWQPGHFQNLYIYMPTVEIPTAYA